MIRNNMYGVNIMRETILLINFQDKTRQREFQIMAITVGVRNVIVKKADYLKPIGALAGIEDMKELQADTEEQAEVKDETKELEKEMVVFAGLSETHLNQMLHLMRKSGMAPVDYKAVLTETNKDWTVPELYAELAREHEAMKAKTDNITI